MFCLSQVNITMYSSSVSYNFFLLWNSQNVKDYVLFSRIPLATIIRLLLFIGSVNSWKLGHLRHLNINHWAGLILQSMLAYVIFVYFVWSCSYFCCVIKYQILGGHLFIYEIPFLACIEGCRAVNEHAKSISNSIHIKGKCTDFGEIFVFSCLYFGNSHM